MNCIKNNTFWTSIEQNYSQYPWLANDVTCDVAIIGGGITGALCALKFAQENINCILVDAKTISSGNSSKSSGILKYPKKSIQEIADKLGMDEAVEIFKLYYKCIDEIEGICEDLHGDVKFKRKDIFSYNYNCEKELKTEFLIKKHNQFPAKLLEETDCMDYFSFLTKGGIYSTKASAVLNPFLFNHAIIEKCENLGVRIFENTAIKSISKSTIGNELISENNFKINCKKVIIATSFDNHKNENNQIKKSNKNYTIITKPIEDFNGWNNECIIDDFSDKNLTLRTTDDRRIIISGFDLTVLEQSTSNEIINFSCLLMNKKFKELQRYLKTMFPAIKNIEVEYAYSSNLLNHKLVLPCVGVDNDNCNCFYVIADVINNISSCLIASNMVVDLYFNQKNSKLNLFV